MPRGVLRCRQLCVAGSSSARAFRGGATGFDELIDIRERTCADAEFLLARAIAAGTEHFELF